MFELNIYESKWILYIKDSLIDCGFPGVWNAQHIPNSFECFKEVIKRRLEINLYRNGRKNYLIVANVQTIEFSKLILF